MSSSDGQSAALWAEHPTSAGDTKEEKKKKESASTHLHAHDQYHANRISLTTCPLDRRPCTSDSLSWPGTRLYAPAVTTTRAPAASRRSRSTRLPTVQSTGITNTDATLRNRVLFTQYTAMFTVPHARTLGGGGVENRRTNTIASVKGERMESG